MAAPRGFTLIELMVVIAVIGVMAAAAAPAVSAVTGANARAAAGELAGAARWLFDTAALRHQTCRLALDLDGDEWWAECTREHFSIAREPGREPEEEDDASLEERFPGERDAERRRLLARPTFAQFQDRMGRKRALRGSASFGEVWSEHLREPASRGVAYVYFHPGGRAEEARIVVGDGDTLYTVVTQPFTGRASVKFGLLEARRP